LIEIKMGKILNILPIMGGVSKSDKQENSEVTLTEYVETERQSKSDAGRKTN